MSSKGIISQAEKRSDHHSILIDDVLYTWGGGHPDLPAVHDSLLKRKWRSKIETFHISTGRWTIRPTTDSPPSGVVGYSCSIIDDYKIAFFGGYCGHDNCFYNSLHQLDIKEFNWTQLSHPPDDIMKRAYGGMITIEDDDGIKLLMIGGFGSPPTIPHQQFQYIELPTGRVRTNEINMFTPSSGKWTTPTMIGDVMPPNGDFTINKITKSRAIIFGGFTTNDMYIMEIVNSTVLWQNIKFLHMIIGQWPKKIAAHASSIISSSVLVVLGGLEQNNQLVNDKCLWLYSINQLSWTKINLPDTVNARHFHSLSSLMIGPHCVWLVVLGGRLQPEKKTIDGVDKWMSDYVSSPNISMIIELMFSDGDWSLGFILDDNSIHLLEFFYKERMKQNPSNDESSLEEDNPLKELNQSLHHDLETSQQTIKSLQEALLDTKEELNKQMIEKDSHIAKMITRKVTESTIVNELEEKVKELTERLREKKQVDDNNPSIDGSTDDITLELEQKNEEISKLTKELESLKKQIEDNKCSINNTQLVHDNESQFTLDDVSKLMVILQPVEDDWYQLGHHLDIEESTLSDVKQLQDSCTVQMEYLLQRWCREGGSLMKLEEALTSMDRTDLISGLHDLKQTSTDDTSSSTDTSVQCDYWNINGLLTVGKKNCIYRADIEHEMTLKECGLKLSIPEAVVTPPESVYEVAAQGLWGGDFMFPEGTNLISGVCYISISSLSHLNKPVTVQLEHCANITHQDQVKYLSFVKANSDRPPYQFQLISGGIFNIHTRHGTISLKKFSLVAIVCISSAFLVQPVSDFILPFSGTAASVSTSLALNGGVYGIAISAVIGLLLYKWLTVPDPKPVIHIPEPTAVSNLQPIAPSPEPAGPIPEPADPIPEHAGPIPEPVDPIPEPVDPIPEPIAPTPVLITNINSVESNKDSCLTYDYIALVMYKTDYVRFIMNFVVIQDNTYSNEVVKQSVSLRLGELAYYFPFKFTKRGILTLSNFPKKKIKGWNIIPQSKPTTIKEESVLKFTESKNKSPPCITVVIQPPNTRITCEIFSYYLKVEGTDEPQRTINICRSHEDLLKSPTLRTLALSSIGTQPTLSTKEQIDIKQLRRVINGVLQSHHANLTYLPVNSLQALADQLYAVNLIGDTVKGNPSINDCIGEFNASLNWLRSQSAIESQCSKFLKAFMAVRGSYFTAANALREDLIEAVNSKFNCNFNIDLS